MSLDERRAKSTAWALTFADVVTLLLTFFVLLLVMLSDAEKRLSTLIEKLLDETYEEMTLGLSYDNIAVDRETKGIKLDGSTATVVDMENTSMDDILIHDETNLDLAHIIANWTSNPDLPEPIGVIYSINKPTYNQDMVDQINFAKEKKGTGSVQDLLNAGDTWKVD